MGERIVMLGGGAVGGYMGGHLALHGHDVTLIDFWHDNIEAIRKNGLELSGMTEEERQVSHPKTLHMHEVAILAKQAPVDIAFMCMKSYDTEWATQLIKPDLAPGGYVVSLQNCINEERIAGIVGWGRTLGCIASRISVELFEPGKVRRQAPKALRVLDIRGRLAGRARRLAHRGGRGQRSPRRVVDELHADVLRGKAHAHPGPLRRAADLLADAPVPPARQVMLLVSSHDSNCRPLSHRPPSSSTY